MKNIDRNLIVRVSKNDKKAFTDLYNIIANPVMAYVNRYYYGYAHLEDAVMDVLSNLPDLCFKFLDKKEHDFLAWIKCVAKNKTTDYYRKNNKEVSLEDNYNYKDNSYEAIYDSFLASELKNILEYTEYEILILYVVYEESINDIATSLNKKPDQIRYIYKKAIKKSKIYLKSTGMY